MNFAPSWNQDLARDLDSILSRSERRPSNQNWPTSPTSDNQNWQTPPAANNQKRRSIGRRMFRAFFRYSIVLLIGIGATLAWQSYGDEAIKVVRTEAPSSAWLLPVSMAKPPPADQGSTTAAASSPQLERLELSLLILRRSVEQVALMVEQLSAKQDQMAQNIATLQSTEQNVRKLSSSRKPATPSSSTEYPSGVILPDKPRTVGSSQETKQSTGHIVSPKN
jgi:hypothetical protein